MIAGGMWTGMRITIYGAMVGTNKAQFIDGSPEKNFYECAGQQAQVAATAIADEATPTGSVRIQISEHP